MPFQSFRMQLVDLVDGVLDLMDADERFAFTLDGQLATVDDYLEIRPEAEERIRARIAEGRIAIGPWQILMDEFLVSGETILRNLETGWKRAEELGAAMPVAYLPDMFGHAAQMPQILRRAGIEHAAAWRGVPAAIDRSAFRWSAPDGSSVRTEYLVHGYGGAAYLLSNPDLLAEKVEVLDAALRPFFGDRPVLAMYGTDHSEPFPELVDLVERVNASQDRYRLEIDTLAGYFDRLDGDEAELPAWTGELRSAARANMLPGVTSARIDVKAACARAERLLERYAEPLQALHGDEWPEPFLRIAWDRVIANSAHDSICGCSVDAVNAQVLVRYAEAEQVAAGLAERATARIAERVERGSVAVVNPSPHARSGLVELDVPAPDEWGEVALALSDGTLVATQEVARNTPVLRSGTLLGERIPEVVSRMLHGRKAFHRFVNGFEIDRREDGTRRLTFEVDSAPDPAWLDMEELKYEVGLAASAALDEEWEVRAVGRARRRLLADVPAPALGWCPVRPVEGEAAVAAPVEVRDEARISNGLVEVSVAADGTLTIRTQDVVLAGVGRLVDGGDFGDSYNYAPPATDTLVEAPEDVSIDVLARGPLRGEIVVKRRFRWPLGLTDGGFARSEATVSTPVATRVELRAGEPFVRLGIEFENHSEDHRLRFHVPLPRHADGSAAEGQFAVVERGLTTEGGHGEVPLPTFPARGWVDAGGVAVLLDHVLEYEVVDGRELALTLLRATGFISRNAHPWREEPAGPEVAIPDAQCRGAWSVGFALFPHGASWSEAGVAEHAERYQHDFAVAPGTGESSEEPSGGLVVEGEGVVLSSLRRRGEALELRVVCQSAQSTTAHISAAFSAARCVDLFGRDEQSFEVDGGRVAVPLSPWEIRTLRLST